MAKEILLTPQGLQDLQNELDYLKVEKRKDIAEKIKIARSFGDLSENSEYDEAKNDQAKVENRIAEIEAMLKNYRIINEHEIDSRVVSIGAKVLLLDVEFGDELEYQIVGSAEADPSAGRISDESPIGKAILGHAEGDTVLADTPEGALEFTVLRISKK